MLALRFPLLKGIFKNFGAKWTTKRKNKEKKRTEGQLVGKKR
jgi:hypothetical protein